LYLCIAGALYLVMSGGGLAWIQDLFLQKVNRSLFVHLWTVCKMHPILLAHDLIMPAFI
jgi:hypothetical protein